MSAEKPPRGLGRTGLLLAALGQVVLAPLALSRIIVDGENRWWNWAAVAGCLFRATAVFVQRRKLQP